MKRFDLIKVDHNTKIGDVCKYLDPNVTEDCIFYADDKPIGFYMTKMPDKMCKLADLANSEFQSKRVPKSIMNRLSAVKGMLRTEWIGSGKVAEVSQMSVILGSIPPKPMVKRPYASRSSVHSVKSAEVFIKAMLLLAKESEELIRQILPEQYKLQTELFK